MPWNGRKSLSVYHNLAQSESHLFTQSRCLHLMLNKYVTVWQLKKNAETTN